MFVCVHAHAVWTGQEQRATPDDIGLIIITLLRGQLGNWSDDDLQHALFDLVCFRLPCDARLKNLKLQQGAVSCPPWE